MTYEQINLVILVISLHTVWDFILQADWMATGKSNSILALTAHVCVYSTWGALTLSPMFVALLFITHWIQDYITSRINSRLWDSGRIHYFFVGVGIDQLMHYVVIFYLLKLCVLI